MPTGRGPPGSLASHMGTASYLDVIRDRIVVFDGATGTWLQGHDLTADDFGGAHLEG